MRIIAPFGHTSIYLSFEIGSLLSSSASAAAGSVAKREGGGSDSDFDQSARCRLGKQYASRYSALSLKFFNPVSLDSGSLFVYLI